MRYQASSIKQHQTGRIMYWHVQEAGRMAAGASIELSPHQEPCMDESVKAQRVDGEGVDAKGSWQTRSAMKMRE
jgi:hypothetical protein